MTSAAACNNPLSEARDQTCIFMDTSRVLYLLRQNQSSCFLFFSILQICFNSLYSDSFYKHVYSFFLSFFLFFFFLSFDFLGLHPRAYGGFLAKGRIGAVAAGLHHSHSNARAKLLLQPTPQLTAMPPDP